MSSSPETLQEAFESDFQDAFRLELLPEYWIETERPHFLNYKRGGSPPKQAVHHEWLTLLDGLKANQQIRRCRVFSSPLSSYLRFEAEWAYKLSKEHGEEIRFIQSRNAIDHLERLPITKDYWMFDNRHVFLMNYDFLGRFLGARRVDDPRIYAEEARKLFEAAVSQGQFFSDQNI